MSDTPARTLLLAQRTPHYASAYFTSLSLENARCFGPKQTLDLTDASGNPARWTVVLGINGTGKTTLLQSLVFFDSRFGLMSGTVRDAGVTYDSFVRLGEEDARFWASRAFNATLESHNANSQVTSIEWQIERETKDRRGGRRGKGIDISGHPWCCAYGAARRLGKTELSKSATDNSTLSIFSDRADLQNPEEWLLRLDYARATHPNGEGQYAERLAQVKDVLVDILPEVEDIRFVTSDRPNPDSRVEFKTPYGWVPLRQLGYGYQTLITWVADFANRLVERYPDSPDPLAEPAVVLVDEIDLHLHPKWQRELMSFLTDRFPNTQFIATAHSPLIVQAAANANLAVLRREGDHVVIDNDVENIRNWRIDQILTSDLFGLKTARPPEIENLLAERNKLLDKNKLTPADRRRLKEIEAEVGELPYGETAQERKEREEIRKTLDLLMKERKSAQ